MTAGGSAMAAGGTATAGGSAMTAGGSAMAAGGSAMAAGGSATGGGGCGPGSLELLQATLDFGSVAPTCSGAQRLLLRNRCGLAQSLSFTVSPPFSTDAGVVAIPAGGVVEVPMQFSPATLGARMGSAGATLSWGSLLVTLRGVGGPGGVVTETVTLPPLPRADVLLVVSDGPHMATPQAWFAGSSSAFLTYATAGQVNYAISSVVGRADGGGLLGAPVTPTTPNLATRFSEKVALGELGSPTESCVARAVDVISADAGFLRSGATLGVVCLQDTYEQLPGQPGAWARWLSGVAGRPVSVSALGVFTPGCTAADDATLRAVVEASGGALQSICATTGGADLLGLRAMGYTTVFPIARRAQEDAGLELRVDGVVVPPTDRGSPVWTYDDARSAVVFEPLFVPEPGKTISVSYTPRCAP